MSIEDVNPLHDDGTSKSPEEITAERRAKGLPPPAGAPGAKTDPDLLLTAMKEEREKRQELERELERMRANPTNPNIVSEEGQALLDQIGAQNEKINGLTTKLDELSTENAKKDVFIKYPFMRDHWEDLEKFRQDPENKGMNLNTAVKAFITEKELNDKPRPGLEKPAGGGTRQAPSTKMTAEEVKQLRESDPKKYRDMLLAGQLDF